MAKSVGVHQAKTHLSQLLEDVAMGEVITITRRGGAVLAPPPSQAPLRFGIDAGRFVVPEDFDAPLPDELIAEFEN
jgi:antitoxin (DNA-binding transcriptional repressor) of toxin-antitoxin stability system